jgi:hypothetical protein
MFSVLNSYDYKNQFTTRKVEIPFLGEYESLDKYKFIYIYAFSSSTDDILTVQFSNKQNDIQYEFNTDRYEIQTDEPLEIIIPKRLNFFRINIINNSLFNRNIRRVYSVYLLDSQYIKTSIVKDPSGSWLVGIDSNVISSVLPDGAATEATLSNINSNIILCDTDNTKVFAKRTTDDVQTQLESDSNNRLITSSYILDGSGSTLSSTLNKLDVSLSDGSGSTLSSTLNKLDVSLSDGFGNIINSTSNRLNVSALISDSNGNNMSFDGLNRLRISYPYVIFDAKYINFKNPNFTEYPLSSITTYDKNSSSILLPSNITNGHCINESKCRFLYQPGKSLFILNSFVFGDVSGNTNPNTQVSILMQKVGYFDDYNGIYLQIDENNVKICKRSYTTPSGSITNTEISISNWNGSLSAKTLDFSKAQIFWIQIEWLGVGTVKTGFILDGELILAHTFNHANSVTSTYMTSAQLPIRYEIQNLWQWTNQTTTSGGNDSSITLVSMKKLSDDSHIIIGNFINDFQITTTTSITLTATPEIPNFFIAKINSDGEWVWVKQSTGNSYKEIKSLTVLSDNSYIVSGIFRYSTDGILIFDNINNITLENEDIEGNNELFTAKINSLGVWQWAKQTN